MSKTEGGTGSGISDEVLAGEYVLGALPDCALRFVRHSASVVMKNRGDIPRDWK